jgi:DNA-binding NtrC family response regulator
MMDVRVEIGPISRAPSRLRTEPAAARALLPDLHGLDLQRQIVADRADMPVIVITGYSDVPVAARAMKRWR